MKTFLLAILTILFVHVAQAQQIESLSDMKKSGRASKIGAYGALQGKLSIMDGRLAVLPGGYGGIFLDKKFLIGGGSYSLANRLRVDGNNSREWGLWYAGGVFEYVHNSDKLFHWSAGALVGGGRVTEREDVRGDHDRDRDRIHASSAAFVAEPFINAEMNITPYIRVIAGGTYRQVLGTSGIGLGNDKLSGPSFHLGVKAGIF
ncbi:hypothetical protein EGT74_25095 [Chitinophaga lutea]|uniref:Outer membrane protein beta-barrel domain-containing protein n=1 Tax=Chitinophaga lutea TaxID=2488634 RepID=A0A3N4Q1L2_9BACT|nr:hypothetical protein [Chitinophaga lutea]RPE05654.1 hypothetical protein EGT74_25095 [Chitinophaga lutea]